MSFRKLDYLSESLQVAIDSYIDRIDANQRDRELLYDIISFAFNEGKIQGKEEMINISSEVEDSETGW